MKKDKQTIKCDVINCSNCDINEMCCNLKEIKISNCSINKKKEATMCDSYKPR